MELSIGFSFLAVAAQHTDISPTNGAEALSTIKVICSRFPASRWSVKLNFTWNKPTMARIDPWAIVEAVFDRGRECANCPHAHHWLETSHFEGSTRHHNMTQCKLLEGNNTGGPGDCPGFEDELQRIANE